MFLCWIEEENEEKKHNNKKNYTHTVRTVNEKIELQCVPESSLSSAKKKEEKFQLFTVNIVLGSFVSNSISCIFVVVVVFFGTWNLANRIIVLSQPIEVSDLLLPFPFDVCFFIRSFVRNRSSEWKYGVGQATVNSSDSLRTRQLTVVIGEGKHIGPNYINPKTLIIFD